MILISYNAFISKPYKTITVNNSNFEGQHTLKKEIQIDSYGLH